MTFRGSSRGEQSLRLLADERCVVTAAREQLRVRAELLDPPRAEHDDPVRLHHRGETMCAVEPWTCYTRALLAGPTAPAPPVGTGPPLVGEARAPRGRAGKLPT